MNDHSSDAFEAREAKVVALLEEMAHLMSLKGENVFKIRAFEKAAGLLSGVTGLTERARAGTLTELDGIGKGIAEVLSEFLLTGESRIREELKESLPAGLLELTQIPGLGPKKAMQLIEELGIESVRELEYACKENRLLKLKGFGVKLQDKILENIRFLQATAGQVRLDQALESSERLAHTLSAILKSRVELTGAIRRKREVVESIELLIEAEAGSLDAKLQPDSATLKRVSEALVDAKSRVGTPLPAIPIVLNFADPKQWGVEWVRTTGSAEHFAKLDLENHTENDRDLAATAGNATEETFYQSRGLPWIDPILRETGEEVQLARENSQSLDQLFQPEQIQGVFHLHTTRSDGAATLEEMVQAARELGYRYVGISDHSQTAFYAQGLKEDALKEQEKEIRQLREKYSDMAIFWGIESDILADGSLDYPDAVLKRFDFVIASIHSRFKMDRETMTERVVQAIRNPYTRFVGHLTGRLLLGRKGYELDMERVIREAAKYDVAIEINAHPQRLDIDWRWGPQLRKYQTLVSVNPDAHEVEGLKDTRYGSWMARKALLPTAQVLNTQSAEDVTKWLKRK